MSGWLGACARVYRTVARAYPRNFRLVCGDGLEQLGDDLVPLVWQSEGPLGVARLFADLAFRLPVEYMKSGFGNMKELTMTGDPFEGTWRAIYDKSQWDPKYTHEQACLRFEATENGYFLVAYGVKDGKAVAERPTTIVADGRRRPILDLNGRPIPGVPPGAVGFGHRPDAYTLEAGAEADGKPLGHGTYHVSPDGKTMTVTTEGLGLKGPFKVVATFERVADPCATGA